MAANHVGRTPPDVRLILRARDHARFLRDDRLRPTQEDRDNVADCLEFMRQRIIELRAEVKDLRGTS